LRSISLLFASFFITDSFSHFPTITLTHAEFCISIFQLTT
jgi:hypothetical protein